MVLDHPIGREDVAADLATEIDVKLRGFGLARFLALLLQLKFIKPRLSCFMALSRFLCWDRSFWHCTTIPVGKWVMRTAESVMLTCWPPAAGGAERVDTEVVQANVDFNLVIHLAGSTKTRRTRCAAGALASKREIRTSRCTRSPTAKGRTHFRR